MLSDYNRAHNQRTLQGDVRGMLPAKINSQFSTLPAYGPVEAVFAEDVETVAKLLSEGELSWSDAEAVLKVLLALHIAQQTNSISNEIEELFVGLFDSLEPEFER